MKKLLFLIPAIFLIGASVLLIQADKTSLSTKGNFVTLAQYSDCMMKNVINKNLCPKSEIYKNAVAYQKKDPYCDSFKDYSDRMYALNMEDTAALDYSQLYSYCRANPQILSIIKQDKCLWEKEYQVELNLCAGLKL
ncbi:hypothetical protein ABPG74_019208 [Tetrahymena malaccensis]